MFDDILLQMDLMKAHVPTTLVLIASLWVIHFVNVLLGHRLNVFGLYPRHPWGLIGVFTSPFLHSNINHLFFNSIPLFILINFVLLQGQQKFICISLTVISLGGMGVWLLGRRALHIGASGLVMGYWSYLLINAYQNPSLMAFILAVICLYYFGGLIFSLLPAEERVSWEGHLFGFLAGLAVPYLC